MSELLRSLTKNELMSESLIFLSKLLIRSFLDSLGNQMSEFPALLEWMCKRDRIRGVVVRDCECESVNHTLSSLTYKYIIIYTSHKSIYIYTIYIYQHRRTLRKCLNKINSIRDNFQIKKNNNNVQLSRSSRGYTGCL